MNGHYVDSEMVAGPSAPPADPTADSSVNYTEATPPNALEAPPPYSTLPSNALETSNFMSPVISSPASSSSLMKLCYMDFVPRLVKKKIFGRDQYEAFSSLMTRANSWLDEHSDIHMLTCETITWCGNNEKNIFSDDTVFRKANNVAYLRGVRFWYQKTIVPQTNMIDRPGMVIRPHTYPIRPVDSLTQLITQINDRLAGVDACEGNIVTIETLKVNLDEGNLNNEETFWKENLFDSKQVFVSVRLYTMLARTTGYETIGYQDFIPSRTNRNKDNKGFELFSDVMDRASRWVARQQGVKFTNIQTVKVKLKKNLPIAERCTYKEHGDKATCFLNVVRVYFVVKRNSTTPATTGQQNLRLSYRTFKPLPISAPNQICQYEDMRLMMERVNKWLQMTGARIFSMETIVTPSSNQLGSEATYVCSKDYDGQLGSRYLYNVRLYLNGDYNETPQAASIVNPI